MNPFKQSFNFHQASKNHYSPDAVSLQPEDWPKEWKTTYYKKYERFKLFKLSDGGEIPSTPFQKVLLNRASRRTFSKGGMSELELSSLLKHSVGEVLSKEGKKHRTHPSGGARYPLEHYIFLFKEIGALKKGIYHYRADLHALELLYRHDFTENDLKRISSEEWISNGVFLHVMTSVFWRSQNKYKERGYRFTLIEAGHAGQNVYLVSESLGLKCCAVGGVFDDVIEKFLDIDGETESVVYTLLVGR